MLEILTLPFMQRALIAGVVISILLAVLGVYVVVKRMAFFGDGIAHASLAGIALGIFVGFAPLPVAIVYAALVAILIYWLEKKTELSSDTIIGILFTASMALGVVLMSLVPGFQPELISFLFGNILTIGMMDVIVIAGLSALVLIWVLARHKQITLVAIDEDTAHIAGINTKLHTIMLYVALAVSVVLGVKLLGIILVSALLLIPVATARLMSHSFHGFMVASIIVGVITTIVGLLLSLFLDAPSGATIILVATAVFFVTTLIAHIVKR